MPLWYVDYFLLKPIKTLDNQENLYPFLKAPTIHLIGGPGSERKLLLRDSSFVLFSFVLFCFVLFCFALFCFSFQWAICNGRAKCLIPNSFFYHFVNHPSSLWSLRGLFHSLLKMAHKPQLLGLSLDIIFLWSPHLFFLLLICFTVVVVNLFIESAK